MFGGKDRKREQDVRIEAAQRELDRITSWIANSDTRAYVALTAQIVVVSIETFLIPNALGGIGSVKNNPSENIYTLFFWLGVWLVSAIGAAGGLLYTLNKILVASNNRTPGNIRPLYEKIADMDVSLFKKSMDSLSPDDIEKNLITEIHNNASIARHKYRSLQQGNTGLLVQVFFLCSFLAATVYYIDDRPQPIPQPHKKTTHVSPTPGVRQGQLKPRSTVRPTPEAKRA